MNANSYTERMEETLYTKWDDLDDYNDDYSGLMELLNSEDSFRTFGEGLLCFLQKKNPALSENGAVKFIEECCIKNNVEKKDIASDGSMRRWFSGGPRPKKGEDSRRAMFAIAFALQLSPEETAELFHKVYLDRAFDYRNISEIIYYFCLKHHKTWQDAQRLIHRVQFSNGNGSDETIYTSHIKTDLENLADEDALLKYIESHGRNLDKKNITAKAKIQELYERAHETALDEATIEVRRNSSGQEIAIYQEAYKGLDKNGKNFTYEVITGLSVVGDTGTKTLFKNARLPKEIRNRFPEAITLSKKDLTYEEVRKLIILLNSYIFWSNAKKQKHPVLLDVYIDELNVYLNESGLSLMYYGNPYDWLFMFCSLSESPLDTFRSVLFEVLQEDSDDV